MPALLLAASLDWGSPWLELLGELLRAGRIIIGRVAREGVYEVLRYECTLELRDPKGMQADIHKREKVRYLQDYVNTFQDQAWGNGQIFLNYRCSPGTPVDQYQLGHNTLKLISLRDTRNRGDMDEFDIEWLMRDGFLRSTGFWGTAINHRSRDVSVNVIFPPSRPPSAASIYERRRQRTTALSPGSHRILPDGRHVISWHIARPRLYEDYILKWKW